MKRLLAALAAFALPAVLAAWVALAPLGGQFAPFDPMARHIVAWQGRNAAVFALVMAGLGLAVLAALAVRSRGPERLTYDPQDQTERTGRRRRRLSVEPEDADGADEAPLFFQPTPEPEPEPKADTVSTAPTAPVALVRKQRERARDWFSDTSWFGGLPRLGATPWPRDAAGTPLPFAAQIDLADLAAARPEMPLPPGGSLAFFLGAGAVVAVPAGVQDFTEPPADLPPAYDEGGQPFPSRTSRLTRWFFPFWPVHTVPLDQPDGADDVEISASLGVATRDHPFYATGVGAPVDVLWWHCVMHLADRLHGALDDAPRLLARRRDELVRQHAERERLRTDAAAMPYALEDATEIAEQMEAEYIVLQDQCAALPEMVEALDGFVAGRDPLKRLTAEELAVVGDILAEIHERYGDAVRDAVPGTLAELATIALRAMISGPPEMLAAIPDATLLRLNREYRLPPAHLHRMFDADGADVILLQLGYDDLMEWSWAETGTWRFRIPAPALASGDLGAATLSFEVD